MIDTCIVVYMLILICNGHTAKVDFGTFTCQQYFGGVAGSAVMQGHAIQQYIAVGFLLHIHIADTYGTCMRFFQFVKVKDSILTDEYFYHLGCQEIHGIHGMITHQHTRLCAIFQYNQYPAVHQEVHVTTQDVYQLNGTFQSDVLRYIQQYTVLCKSGIECCHSVF